MLFNFKLSQQPNNNIQMEINDIYINSRRGVINRFKKNKGVKRTSDHDKYAEQNFWKRARNIQLQKQSRNDNYVREDDDEYVAPAPARKLVFPELPAPVFVDMPWTVTVPTPGRGKSCTTTRLNVRSVPPQLVLYQPTVLGPVSTDLIHLKIRQIEYFMEQAGVPYVNDYDTASWTCYNDSFVAQMRLWHQNDKLILEAGYRDGNFDDFYQSLLDHVHPR